MSGERNHSVEIDGLVAKLLGERAVLRRLKAGKEPARLPCHLTGLPQIED